MSRNVIESASKEVNIYQKPLITRINRNFQSSRKTLHSRINNQFFSSRIRLIQFWASCTSSLGQPFRSITMRHYNVAYECVLYNTEAIEEEIDWGGPGPRVSWICQAARWRFLFCITLCRPQRNGAAWGSVRVYGNIINPLCMCVVCVLIRI